MIKIKNKKYLQVEPTLTRPMLLKLKIVNLAQSTSIVHRDPRQTGLTVPQDSIVLEIKLLDFKMPVLLEHMDQTSVIKVSWYCSEGVWLGVTLFNATSNNISVYIMAVSFIGGGNQSSWRKTLSYRKSLTKFIT